MSPLPAFTPTSFGRYRLVERLGAGGMAHVFKAIVDGPEGFNRTVVVKRMLPQFSEDPAFVKMLLSEARLSALLHHPAIVQVYELGQVNGEHFMTMEYVDGLDLVHLMRQLEGRTLPPALAAYVINELAGALGYAHSLTDDQHRPLEIIHRDISPSNVMISRAGAIKLLDFGIARAASCVRDDQTRTGTLKGKLSYMSPEQADGLHLDKRSDIFALGIVLWELLTRRRLFRADDDLKTLRLVRQAIVTPPSLLVSGVDADLDKLVMKLLAKNLNERFQSCEDVVTALSPIVHRLQGDAGTMRKFLEALPPVATPLPAIAERTAPPPPDAAATVVSAEPSAAFIPHGELKPSTAISLRPKVSRRWLVVGAGLALGAVALVAINVASRPAPVVTAAKPAPPPIVKVEPPPPIVKVEPPPPPLIAPIVKAEPPPVKVAAAEAPKPKPHVVKTPPPPAPRMVKLSVQGTPGAQLFVDGKAAGRLPAELSLPSRAAPRMVSVRAPSHEPFSERIAGDTDGRLQANLRQIVAPKPAPKPSEIHDPFAR